MSPEHSTTRHDGRLDPPAPPVAHPDDRELLYAELTRQIIGAAMKVHRVLGAGFAEKVYHEAMKVELAAIGLAAESERWFYVTYAGQRVGRFRTDLVAEDKVLLELKAMEMLSALFRQQTVSYLKASELKVGLLFNFGAKSLVYERFVN